MELNRVGLWIFSRILLEDYGLKQLPVLPPGARWVALRDDFVTNAIEIKFYHPDLPITSDGNYYPAYAPQLVDDKIVWPEDWITSCKVG